MDLEPYLLQLHRDLAAAAHSGDDSVQAAAARLAAAIEPAARLVLLDALVGAADEVTLTAGVTVEVRLRGREVELVVDAATPEPMAVHPTDVAPSATGDGDDLTARVSLRLPDALKARAESRAATEGISLNTWLVRTIAAAATEDASRGRGHGRGHGPGTRLTGWARS